MKKIIFILALFANLFAYAQLVVDAGGNKHICTETTVIGGTPTATGGIPPYTYEWSITPISYFPTVGFPYLYASHFLNDTSLANPTLVSLFGKDSVMFYLTITDSVGATATSSCVVTKSYFVIHLAEAIYNITKGDSIYYTLGSNVLSNLSPVTYTWRPAHGLRDTTLEANFWAKPDYSIDYYVSITDTKGCKATAGSCFHVRVSGVGIQENEESSFNIFPNPANTSINIQLQDEMLGKTNIVITNIAGQMVKSISANTHSSFEIPINDLKNGMYFITLSNDKKRFTKKLIVQH